MSTSRITVADLAALVQEQQAQIAALTAALTARPAPAPAARKASPTRSPRPSNPDAPTRKERSRGYFLFEKHLFEAVRNKVDSRTYVVQHEVRTSDRGTSYVGETYLKDITAEHLAEVGKPLTEAQVAKAFAVLQAEVDKRKAAASAA